MKIKNIEFQGGSISKDYRIELPNGSVIIVNKWASDNTCGDYDNGYKVLYPDQSTLDTWINELGDNHADERSDQFDDFMTAINVWKD